MPDWLQGRGRAILRLLSELGGALAFVTAAVGLIVAAVAGTALVAIEVFPQPFLSFLVLGLALLAMGIALHFLRGPLTPKSANPVSAPDPSPPPQPQGDEANLVGAVLDNPYAKAAATQRQYNEAKARKALRRIREELRDNRRHVQRAGEGDLERIHQISFGQWGDGEELLLDLPDSAPHSAARQAYRELEGIEDVCYVRDPTFPRVLERRDQPLDLLETDVLTTIQAIDEAIETLTAAESAE